jgi:hypothetical protein
VSERTVDKCRCDLRKSPPQGGRENGIRFVRRLHVLLRHHDSAHHSTFVQKQYGDHLYMCARQQDKFPVFLACTTADRLPHDSNMAKFGARHEATVKEDCVPMPGPKVTTVTIPA